MDPAAEEMSARARRIVNKSRVRGRATTADLEELARAVDLLAGRVEDLTADIGDLMEQLSDYAAEDRQLEDARALARALWDRARDFVTDEDVMGEGLSWNTLPDWLTNEEHGRDLWDYGREDT